MFAWDKANQLLWTPQPAATFAPEELGRLTALRERYQTSQNCGEFGLDERRLRFARWLVEQGRLHEDEEVDSGQP